MKPNDTINFEQVGYLLRRLTLIIFNLGFYLALSLSAGLLERGVSFCKNPGFRLAYWIIHGTI